VKRALPLLALLSLAPAVGRAEHPAGPDPLLDRLSGQWVLRGTIAGKTTTHDIDARWVLGDTYLEIHETAREKTLTGRPAYEAKIFLAWNEGKQQYVCLWLDDTAVISEAVLGTAKRAQDEIAFVFSLKDTTLHTTFAYDRKKDTWTWRIDDEEKGKLSPFARVELRRP
jgi:hypothetical protein